MLYVWRLKKLLFSLVAARINVDSSYVPFYFIYCIFSIFVVCSGTDMLDLKNVYSDWYCI